jgi:hypothetical protein
MHDSRLQQLVVEWREAASRHEAAQGRLALEDPERAAHTAENDKLSRGTDVLMRWFKDGSAAGYATGLRQAAQWLAEQIGSPE